MKHYLVIYLLFLFFSTILSDGYGSPPPYGSTTPQPKAPPPPPPCYGYGCPPPPPPPKPTSCFEDMSCPGENFRRLDRVQGSKPFELLLWTRQNGFGEKCPALLAEISNPCSPKYGHYYSYQDIKKETYNANDIRIITNYISRIIGSSCSIVPSDNGDYVKVTTTIKNVETLFKNEFYNWQSTTTGEIFIGAVDYTMPAELDGPVTYPMNTGQTGSSSSTGTPPPTYVPPPPPTPMPPVDPPPPEPEKKKRSLSAQSQYRDFIHTDVALLRSHYNWDKEFENYGEYGSQSVMGAINQSFRKDDLTKWQDYNGLPHTDVQVHGNNTPSDCERDSSKCFEASLDVQYILSLNPKATTWFWSVPKNPFFSPFWRLVSELSAMESPPDVHSISYANSEKYMNPREAKKFNEEACKLALRGLTIIVASGDSGSHGIEGCYPPPAGKPFPENCTIAPLFPASCPYVTAVGATMGPEYGEDEVAATVDYGAEFSSGGGFSNIFERPAWQNKVIKKYLKSGNTGAIKVDTALFNANGRAYPDVSILGNEFLVKLNGNNETLGGTSAAAPVFASLISLANSMRLKNNKPKLGFLNPLLYNKLLEEFYNDITTGNSRCCQKWCCPKSTGFSATWGWDPVTGLGSLDFKKFLNFIKDYPKDHRIKEKNA